MILRLADKHKRYETLRSHPGTVRKDIVQQRRREGAGKEGRTSKGTGRVGAGREGRMSKGTGREGTGRADERDRDRKEESRFGLAVVH